MLTDVDACSVDVAQRRMYRYVSHRDLGGEDCVSVLVCKATESGWRAVRAGLPSCSEGVVSDRLLWPLTDHLCASLDPLPEHFWYDARGFERVRRRYRFGTATRDHCAVPAWMLVKEEPLRLYSLIHAKSRVTRILINVGAADAEESDPLGQTLKAFGHGFPPWKGVYFEAAVENCQAAQRTFDSLGAQIHMACGYVTPKSVLEIICEELERQQVGGIKEVCNSIGLGKDVDIETMEELRELRVEVDAMNVDIDSYDCGVLREVLRVVSPKMISVEIFPYPPPIVVSSDFHPMHEETAKRLSGPRAKLGLGSNRDGAFLMGCSLSQAISLLWPHGLGLYRLSARDALFVRGDVAEEILETKWLPADEFHCWRRICSDLHQKDINLMKLTSLGVYDHLLPFVHRRVRDVLLNGSYPQHPLTVSVALPPPARYLPEVKLYGAVERKRR